MPRDDDGYNVIVVFIDRFSKKTVSLSYKKTVTVKVLAEFYVMYYYRYIRLPDSIMSNRGPQFVSKFWGTLYDLL
jgi:ribosomal protein S17